MAKYEIMIVINGSLKEADAEKVAKNTSKLLDGTKNLELKFLGHKELAYEIDKEKTGYYYTLNFETDKPQIVHECRRLIFLDKNIIRNLIVNLEKDYGFKATQNPKKIAKSAYRSKVYKEVTEKILSEQDELKKEKDTSSVKLTDI